MTQNSNATVDGPAYNTADLVPFHTDDTMAKLNTAEQNNEHFLSLPADRQQALRDECSGSVAGAMTDENVDDETTASIGNDGMPMTFADLCSQNSAW